MIDGAHTIQAVLSYGPVLYADPETSSLVSVDLYSSRWIWWTRVGESDTWTPEVTSPAEEAILRVAEELVENATQWHKAQIG